jgi:RNA polymerase sigma-70 factor (ECF subfamily)
MLDAEPEAPRSLAAGFDLALVRERLECLAKDVPAAELRRMLDLLDDAQRSAESMRDALSTRLMEVFRLKASRGSFGLLYELNSQHLLGQVSSCLRRYGNKADPRDVLQEVFFNVYRYPHRFNCEREDAFRVWSAMIVRNTVLKHLRSQARGGRMEVPFEDLSDQPELRPTSPVRGVIERESARECGRVYLTYLHLYLQFYSMLSARERRAIHLVEVEECSYREAAERLGIKLENLKMVIFRARRKIHRSMRRVFDGLPHDCRPAREPKMGPPKMDPRMGTAERAWRAEDALRAPAGDANAEDGGATESSEGRGTHHRAGSSEEGG